jgi:N-acetylmuramic acid 6-phosphate (MurNAc-6-P) etherase
VSGGGLIRKEAKMVLKVLAARTAIKAGKTYSNIMGYVRARLIIAIVRSTYV